MQEKKVFEDFWEWYKAYHTIVNTDEWWDGMIMASRWTEKYKGTELHDLARELIIVGVNEIRRREERGDYKAISSTRGSRERS